MDNEQFRPWDRLWGLPQTQRGTGFTQDRFINGKPMTALLTGVSVITLLCLTQNSPDALQVGTGGIGTGDLRPHQSHQNTVPERYHGSGIIAQQEPTIASPLQGFCHPLKGSGYLSQGIRSGTHQGRTEYAYDLAVSIGSPVYAMHQGRVIAREDRYPDDGGGKGKISKFNYIWLEHEDGHRSAYLHLQQGFGRKVSLREGTWVRTGQMIGYSGNSGWSTAPHLHIEVQQPGSLDKFTKTVPFSIAENCSGGQISKRTG